MAPVWEILLLPLRSAEIAIAGALCLLFSPRYSVLNLPNVGIGEWKPFPFLIQQLHVLQIKVKNKAIFSLKNVFCNKSALFSN